MSHLNHRFEVRLAAVALLIVGLAAAAVFRLGQASAAPSLSPAVIATSLAADCPVFGVAIGSSFTKVGDIGPFEVRSAGSLIEATFHGRINAGSMTGQAVIFELRVDDAPSSAGRARALIRSTEAGGPGVNASLGGFFDGLAPGMHTASLWAQTTHSGTAQEVMWNKNCFAADHVTVLEYLPFGAVALPAVVRP